MLIGFNCFKIIKILANFFIEAIEAIFHCPLPEKSDLILLSIFTKKFLISQKGEDTFDSYCEKAIIVHCEHKA